MYGRMAGCWVEALTAENGGQGEEMLIEVNNRPEEQLVITGHYNDLFCILVAFARLCDFVRGI